MEEKMKKLLILLEDENRRIVEIPEEELDDFVYYSAEAEYPEDIKSDMELLCDELFISKGMPNRENIKKFEAIANGYKVKPGVVCAFGWETGVIAKGSVLYFCFG